MPTVKCPRCKTPFRQQGCSAGEELVCPLCAYLSAGIRKSPELALQLGEHFADQRQLDQASAAFTEAIQLNPALATAYAGRANVYLAKKDYPRALHQFTEALRLDPQFVSAYANRALCLLELENFDAALIDLNRALKIVPSAEILRRIELVINAKERGRKATPKPEQSAGHVKTSTPGNTVKAPPGTERKYFYRRRGKVYGPHTSVDLKGLADKGFLDPKDELQRQGHSTWHRACDVKGLFRPSGKEPIPTKPQPPSEAGTFQRCPGDTAAFDQPFPASVIEEYFQEPSTPMPFMPDANYSGTPTPNPALAEIALPPTPFPVARPAPVATPTPVPDYPVARPAAVSPPPVPVAEETIFVPPEFRAAATGPTPPPLPRSGTPTLSPLPSSGPPPLPGKEESIFVPPELFSTRTGPLPPPLPISSGPPPLPGQEGSILLPPGLETSPPFRQPPPLPTPPLLPEFQAGQFSSDEQSIMVPPGLLGPAESPLPPHIPPDENRPGKPPPLPMSHRKRGRRKP